MKMKKINKLKQFRKHQAKLSLMALAMSNLAHADLTSGLVAHYPFNGNANDVSGNGNNGIVYGATLTADRFGNANSAYNFDGISNYISVPSSTSLNPVNQLTMSFWIKVLGITNSWSPILHKGGVYTSDFANREYTVWLNEAPYFHQTSAGNGAGQSYFNSSNITISSWIHYVGVIDRVNHAVHIYLDGQKVAEQSDSYSSFNNNQNALRIGWTEESDSSYSPLKGILDDIRIYNRALSPSEITELYTLKNPNTPLAPTSTSKPATNITINSATLNGNVISNGTTATANFEFGPTVTYGTTVAAAPAQIYSSTPIAISANKTGLACNTTYHYRAKAVNSVGTGYGTDQSFTTLATCAHNTWLYPATPAVLVGKTFPLDIHVNSNNNAVGAYDYTVNFDPTKLLVDTAYQNAAATCEQGICPGTSALSASSVNVDNSSGNIRLTGFDTTGTGPGNDLQLLHMHFVAKNTPGATVVGLTTNELTNAVGEPLGSAATGATVTISTGLCGDSDGNASVNIVDALAISRYLVGLPPPPTVNSTLADVNRSGTVSIVDALHIARYAVGLVVTGTCAIGQPL